MKRLGQVMRGDEDYDYVERERRKYKGREERERGRPKRRWYERALEGGMRELWMDENKLLGEKVYDQAAWI